MAAAGVVAVSTSAGGMVIVAVVVIAVVVVLASVVVVMATIVMATIVIVIVIVPNHQTATDWLIGAARQAARQLSIRPVSLLSITPGGRGGTDRVKVWNMG